jgi:AAA family ATP:ADP antiporter
MDVRMTRAGPSLPLRIASRLFGRIAPGEGLQAGLMVATLFLILCSYYAMKTAREGMILSQHDFGMSGQEAKAYASGAMAVLLVAVMPLYNALAGRLTRIRLINVTYLVVLVCLTVFYVLAKTGVSTALPFFIWLGLINVFLVAQFWSFANDLYSEEQGQRLFAVIAIGGSLGAVAGPRLAELTDVNGLLPLAAAILLPCIALFNIVERHHTRVPHAREVARRPIDGRGAFHLLATDRYLLLLAGLVFISALVKTTGEFVLSDAASSYAVSMVPDSAHADLVETARHAAVVADRAEVIKGFYSGFFFWVNLVSFVIQAFAVSRIIQRLGVHRALLFMPLIALGAYGLIAAIGGVAVVRFAKIAENSADYSLENTVRQTLFLPTTRAAKYKAKVLIDTFAVRAGDTLSAVLIWVSLHFLDVHTRGLAVVNVVLVSTWMLIAVALAARYRAAVRRNDAPSPVVLGETGPTRVVAARTLANASTTP